MSNKKRIVTVALGLFAIVFGWGSYETVGNNIFEETKNTDSANDLVYQFADETKLNHHYVKHKVEFGDITEEDYLLQANRLLLSDDEGVLKKQQEDGDTAIYNYDTNEFAVLSEDGIIRTYFKPESGMAYFNRQ